MNPDVWCDFVAGWIGGCAGLLAGHPMDTIKVRQQALGKVSALSGIAKTFKYEGVRGFYKGMGFPLLATGTLNSLFFGVYGNCMRSLHDGKEKPSLTQVFLSGCAGGVVQLAVACPVDLVKIKMQLQTEGDANAWGKSKNLQGRTPEPRYRGPTACLMDLYRTAGVRGCYYGLGSMALRDVPSFGYYMVIYEFMMRQIAGREEAASPATLMFCGGMAGAISWVTIVPIDVIKSRVQADSVTNPQYKNFWDCCVKSYRNEGLGVFTRGFSMVILRALPTNGAIFLGYVSSMNILRAWLNGRRENQVTDCAGA
ncbi:Mitochondrial substrate/solute carrier [Trinorchestia longiramus]|nr:Mitochondrial substrate/solute carrier [Trinorchestia longiramus]